MRHIYGNFKGKFGGKEIKVAYQAVAKPTTMQEFMNKIGNIAKVSKNIVGQLLELEIEHWSRHTWSFRPQSRLLLNNPSKCFNGLIDGMNREKPITTLLEGIRKKIMAIIHRKKDKIMKYSGPICPKIQKKVEKVKHKFRHWYQFLMAPTLFRFVVVRHNLLWT